MYMLWLVWQVGEIWNEKIHIGWNMRALKQIIKN